MLIKLLKGLEKKSSANWIMHISIRWINNSQLLSSLSTWLYESNIVKEKPKESLYINNQKVYSQWTVSWQMKIKKTNSSTSENEKFYILKVTRPLIILRGQWNTSGSPYISKSWCNSRTSTAKQGWKAQIGVLEFSCPCSNMTTILTTVQTPLPILIHADECHVMGNLDRTIIPLISLFILMSNSRIRRQTCFCSAFKKLSDRDFVTKSCELMFVLKISITWQSTPPWHETHESYSLASH